MNTWKLVKELSDLLEAYEIDGEEIDPQSIRNVMNKYTVPPKTENMIDAQKSKQFLCGLLAQLIKTDRDQKVCCEYNIAIDDAIEAIIFHFPFNNKPK